MLSRTTVSALAFAFFPALSNAQGLPDCLIGNDDPASKSVLRLVDRNFDGVYDDGLGAGQNEAFDWLKIETFYFNSSFRTVLPCFTVPGAFYVVDGGYNSPEPDAFILLVRDLNGDGVIDDGEITPALTGRFTQQIDMEIEEVATDGLAYYAVVGALDAEGLWQLEDLNNDGDFMDTVNGVDEFRPQAVEVANRTVRVGQPGGGTVGSDTTWSMTNLPNTSAAAAYYLPTESQRIMFDPNVSPGSLAIGRFIVEEEECDCLICFEDKDGDGDFIDAATSTADFGEIYLWCQLVTATNAGNNRFVNDANPDCGVTLPATSWEASQVVVDTNVVPNVYYILNSEARNTQVSYNNIFRAVDANGDGDVNDAGEVTLYFEAKETDPVMPLMAGLTAIEIWAGDVFVVAKKQLPGGELRDIIIRLDDANQDNVIDNGTEVTTVFTLPANRSLQHLNFFAPGTLGIAPPGLPGMFEYTNLATCTTNAGTQHALVVGGDVLGDNVPRLGNRIKLRTLAAPPSAPSAMFLGGLAGAPLPLSLFGLGPCSIGVDLGNLTVIGAQSTNVSGEFALTLLVPRDPGFTGTNLYFESLSLDLVGGPPQVTVSNTVRIQFSDYSYTPPMALGL